MRRVLCAVLAVFCVGALGAQSIDPTAATVKLAKTESISVRALKKQMDAFEAAAKQQGRSLTDSEKTDVLYLLIDRILFRQAAERDHIRMTQEQLQMAIEQARQALSQSVGRAATDADLRAIAAQQGMTWDQWIEQLKDSAMPEIYVSQTRTAAIQNVDPPTDKEISRYHRANISQFVVGEIVEFKHIAVWTRDKTTKEARDAARTKIDDVAQRLRKGESFEDLVVKFSEDTTTAKQGGYVGHIQADRTEERQAYGTEFVEAIFDLAEGQVSGVLQSSQGYHIIKVIKKIPAKLYGLDETTPPEYKVTPRSAIRSAVLTSKMEQALRNEITKVKEELRKQAKIEIVEANLGFPLKKVD